MRYIRLAQGRERCAGFCVRGFLHNDDIQTMAMDEESLKTQVEIVSKFAAVTGDRYG